MLWASFSMLDGPGGENNTYYSARSRWTKQQQSSPHGDVWGMPDIQLKYIILTQGLP